MASSQATYDIHAAERVPSSLLPLARLSIETALGVLDPQRGCTTIADPVGHLRQALACVKRADDQDTARLARVALEERLDKVERARVYAEDQARHCRSELEAAERRVERMEQSMASRDEKERGKIERQKVAIKALEVRNARLVEQVAAQWALAEEAKTRASALRAEVQRLAVVVSRGTSGDPAMRDEIVRLQGVIAGLEKIKAAAQKLKRGCDCEYDDRCTRCQHVLDVLALARDES